MSRQVDGLSGHAKPGMTPGCLCPAPHPAASSQQLSGPPKELHFLSLADPMHTRDQALFTPPCSHALLLHPCHRRGSQDTDASGGLIKVTLLVIGRTEI